MRGSSALSRRGASSFAPADTGQRVRLCCADGPDSAVKSCEAGSDTPGMEGNTHEGCLDCNWMVLRLASVGLLPRIWSVWNFVGPLLLCLGRRKPTRHCVGWHVGCESRADQPFWPRVYCILTRDDGAK